MAFEQLEFSESWKEPMDFPTYEPDEIQVRADLQLLHDEAKDAINRLVAALNDPSAASQLPFTSLSGLHANTVQGAIEEVYAALQSAYEGSIVDGTVSKEKLSPELLRRVYGGRVWLSMMAPEETHNPETDFPVGQLWLCPPFTVKNLAQDTWVVNTGGTVEPEDDGWRFVRDKSEETLNVQQLFEQVGTAGQTIKVQLELGEYEEVLQELKIVLNGMDYDPEDGSVFEMELDQDGSAEILLQGKWAEAQEEVEQSFSVQSLVVINTDAAQLPGCEPYSDWSVFLAPLVGIDELTVPGSLWVQEGFGQWKHLVPHVLPVSRGGTGLGQVPKGALLCGTGTDELLALTSAENGILQWSDGAPVWTNYTQLAKNGGYLRTMTGSYSGVGGCGKTTVTLPVTPLILFIYPEDNSYSTVCLLNGGKSSDTYYLNTNNTSMPYWAQVVLTGSQLEFSNEQRGTEANEMYSQHMNAAGVTYHWVAVY